MEEVKATLWFDGACHGNPGPCGAGAIIRGNGRTIPVAAALPFKATNNVAEYFGLIEGLRKARSLRVTHLEVIGDSELVVKQMRGEYRVKKAHLRPLHAEATRLAKDFTQVTWIWVPREQNTEADAQSNLAVDEAEARRENLTSYDAWLSSLDGKAQGRLF